MDEPIQHIFALHLTTKITPMFFRKEYTSIFIFLSVFIFFHTACREEKETESNFTHHFKLSKIEDSVPFDDLVENYRYIKLETNEQCLIGEVEKVLFYEDKLFILSGGVFCFNLNGEFLYAINHRGKGPSEFLRIRGLSINNDTVYVYDNGLYKLLCFDSNTGKYLKYHKMLYSVVNAQILDGFLMMNSGGNRSTGKFGHGRVVVSELTNQESVKAYLPLKSGDAQIENQLQVYNAGAYWTSPVFNKVYKISESGVENYIFFDFGEKNVSKSEVLNFTTKELMDQGKAYFVQNCFENKDFIAADIGVGGRPHFIIVNKNTGDYRVYKNTIRDSYELNPTFHGANDEYFIQVYPSLIIDSFIKPKMIEEGKSLSPEHPDYQNYKILMDTGPMDNPIVVLYQLKQ